jgi:hypothetical protein
MEYLHWKNKKKSKKSLSPDKILEKIWAAAIRTAKNLLQVYAIRNCSLTAEEKRTKAPQPLP